MKWLIILLLLASANNNNDKKESGLVLFGKIILVFVIAAMI